jgi:hypothetical protein
VVIHTMGRIAIEVYATDRRQFERMSKILSDAAAALQSLDGKHSLLGGGGDACQTDQDARAASSATPEPANPSTRTVWSSPRPSGRGTTRELKPARYVITGTRPRLRRPSSEIGGPRTRPPADVTSTSSSMRQPRASLNFSISA